jgi:hypothetical protein
MIRLVGWKRVAILVFLAVFVAGCGGSSSNSNIATVPPAPDFSLSATRPTVNLQAGGTAQTFNVIATALNGFSGVINVSLSGLPNGLAVTPATLALTPGISQQISVNAASTEAGGTATVTVEAVSGSIGHSAQLTITVQPVAPNFSLSLSPTSISLPGRWSSTASQHYRQCGGCIHFAGECKSGRAAHGGDCVALYAYTDAG